MNFFDISSVAIIWASDTAGKIWNDLLKNMSGFSGEVYGVNPKALTPNPSPIGRGELYPSIDALPTIPDIAVFAIPAKFVAESLRQCGEKGIKKVIIISAGFKEVWDVAAEQELIDIAKQYDIRLLWPNCLGYIDTTKKINLSFGGKEIKNGNIAMISQSGAMAVAFTDWAYEYGVGFSKIISMGNKADLCENDFLQELVDDEQTDVIALYLESMEQGREFYETAKKVSKTKPVIIVKSGMSDRWSAAAASHTGALASSADVIKTAFSQSGLHYTNKLEDFFLWGQAFTATRNKEIPQEMVVITNAGWPGVMTTDHMEFNDVKIAEFNESEEKILMQGLPDAASVHNPIDVIWDARSDRYEAILNNIASLDRNLAILVLLTPQTVTDTDVIAEKIIAFQKSHPERLIFTSFMGGHSLGKSRELLESAGVLHYNYPQKGIVAFSKLQQQAQWEAVSEPSPPAPLPPGEGSLEKLQDKLKNSKEKLCSSELTQEILEAYDIETTKEYLVNSHDDVIDVFSSFAGPVVAKISSPDIAHKTDVGWIITDIKTLSAATRAYDKILARVWKLKPDAQIDGVILQAQIPKSREIFVGLKRDVSFGDMLIVGMWGIYVNVYNDVQRWLLPLTQSEIQNMFQNLQITPILKWVRWEKAIDFEKLSDSVYKLSELFVSLPDIKEIDINPILANHESAIVVDAKFYL